MRLVYLILIFLIATAAGADKKKKKQRLVEEPVAKMYSLNNMPSDVVLELIKMKLSEEGRARYVKRMNGILVMDGPSIHEKIKKMMAQAVRDPVNIMVKVEFLSSGNFSSHGIEYNSDGKKGLNVRIENGKIKKPKKIGVKVHNSKVNTSDNSVSFLTTLSGYAANLWVTKNSYDRRLFEDYEILQFTPAGGNTQLIKTSKVEILAEKQIGLQLWMKPVYQDNGLIVIDIFSVLTTERKDGTGMNRYMVKSVKTRVIARSGQRIFLGGSSKSMNKFLTNIFGGNIYKKGKGNQALSIYLTPTAKKMVKPDHLKPIRRR